MSMPTSRDVLCLNDSGPTRALRATVLPLAPKADPRSGACFTIAQYFRDRKIDRELALIAFNDSVQNLEAFGTHV